MKKIYIVLICFSLITSILVGCFDYPWHNYHPASCLDTIWKTEDNSVVIEINEFSGDYERGYLNILNENIQVFFYLPERPDICIMTKEQIETDSMECLECWRAQTPEKDKFVVTVEKTTYFNVGDVLTFYNVGENTNNDNHISYDDVNKIATAAIPQKDYEQIALFSRKETIENKEYFVFYARAQSWKLLGDDYYSYGTVNTHWIYIDAVTGEVDEVKATGAKVNVTKEDALKEYNGK